MLRLTKVLSLKSDVLAKAPKNTSAAYQNEPPRMTLIGKEREGLLLLSREGRDTAGTPHTYIDSYDPKTRELRTLYTHPTPVLMTGASISEDRALLIFTVKVKVSDERDLNNPVVMASSDGVHSSHIVELSPIGKVYSMDVSLGFHKICFLYGIGERGSSYAIVILPDEVIMVQITTKMEAGYVSISKKEKKRTSLNKKHVWYQFDTTRSILYLLSPKSTKFVTDEYILKCFHFSYHKVNTFYEVPLFISLPPPLSPNPGMGVPSNPSRIESNFPYPYVIGGSLPVVQPHITLVRLSGNGQCLCIQREVDSVCTIRVTIYFLHLKLRLDYAIPMTNLEGGWSEYSKLRLVFDSIGNLLLIYLPGHFLQLLDCGEDHSPCLSLTMCGKELVTAIPDSNEPNNLPPLFPNFSPHPIHSSKLSSMSNLSISHSSPSISLSHPNITTMSQSSHNLMGSSSSSRSIPIMENPPQNATNSPQPNISSVPTTTVAFHLTRYDSSSNNGNLGGICHSLLDCGSGNIYEYTFDREAILKLFEQDSHRVHVQALHLACVHMQDTELVDQIMIHIFSHNPHSVGVDLLKEFLICTPYFIMKQNAVEPHLLQLLPITTQDYLDSAQLKRFSLQQVSITTLTGYSMVPGTKILIRDRDKDDDLRKKRFPPEKNWNTSRGNYAPYASPTRDTYSPLAVSRFFRSVLGFDDDVKTSPPRIVESQRRDDYYYSSPPSVRNLSSSYANIATSPANNSQNSKDGNNSSTPVEIPPSTKQNDSESSYLNEWEIETGDCCSPPSGQFVECLTDYWMGAFPKESKSKCTNHAMNYRTAQMQQINRLFSHMVTSCRSAHSEDMSLFQLMEKLYCACEDLAVPFPKDFHSLFAQLGLKCLSRPVFLQYVERGIFTFTQSFIRDLLNMPVNAPEDQNFQNQMILKLKFQAKINELLQQSSANINFLLEHFLSSITAQCLDVTDNMHLTHGPPDLEKYSSSSFLPLSILLDFINTIYTTCLTPPSPLSSTPPLLGSSLPNFINNPELEFVNINAFNVVRTAFSNPLDIE